MNGQTDLFPAPPELRKTKMLNTDMYSTFMRTWSNIVRLKVQSSAKCSKKYSATSGLLLPSPHYTPLPPFVPAVMVGCFCCYIRAIISSKCLAKNRPAFKD